MSGHIEIVAELIRRIGGCDHESTRNAIQNRTVCVEGLNDLSQRCGFTVEVSRKSRILGDGDLLGCIRQSIAPRQEDISWIGLGLYGDCLVEIKLIFAVRSENVSPSGNVLGKGQVIGQGRKNCLYDAIRGNGRSCGCRSGRGKGTAFPMTEDIVGVGCSRETDRVSMEVSATGALCHTSSRPRVDHDIVLIQIEGGFKGQIVGNRRCYARLIRERQDC